jgi:hypothetical protein
LVFPLPHGLGLVFFIHDGKGQFAASAPEDTGSHPVAIDQKGWCNCLKIGCNVQYLCQLGKAEGGLRGMNTAQAGDLVENLGK